MNDIKIRERKTFKGGTETQMIPLVQPVFEAEIAKNLVERWGMVAAVEDGEDSSGRQKLRLLTPDELAKRACNTADILWNEFKKRGWLLDLPVPKEPKRDV